MSDAPPQPLDYASPQTPRTGYFESPAFSVFTWNWRAILVQSANRSAAAGFMLLAPAIALKKLIEKDPDSAWPLVPQTPGALALLAGIVAILASLLSWWTRPNHTDKPLGATLFSAIYLLTAVASIAAFKIPILAPLRDWFTFGLRSPEPHKTALILAIIAIPLLPIWLLLSWFYGPRKPLS